MADLRPNREFGPSSNNRNKNPRQGKTKSEQPSGKKPFDKKKYREQKYSNKYKIDEWKERKKKASLRALYAEIERDKKKLKPRPFNPITQDDCDDTDISKATKSSKGKKLPNESPKEDTKQNELDERKNKAMKEYKQNRSQIFKKKRIFTKKGQPVMKHRLQLMLDKIKLSH